MMYNELTTEYSLFIVEQSLVQDFIERVELYETMMEDVRLSMAQHIDYWSIMLNIWLNGERTRHYHIIRPEIELFYCVDSTIIRLLNTHTLYNKFIAQADDEQRFLFAFCFGKRLLSWLLPQLAKFSWSAYNVPYYSLYKTLTIEENSHFIIGQALVMKQFIELYEQNTVLEQWLRESAAELKQYKQQKKLM